MVNIYVIRHSQLIAAARKARVEILDIAFHVLRLLALRSLLALRGLLAFGDLLTRIAAVRNLFARAAARRFVFFVALAAICPHRRAQQCDWYGEACEPHPS
jgi:hypothetical protein